MVAAGAVVFCSLTQAMYSCVYPGIAREIAVAMNTRSPENASSQNIAQL